MTLVPTDLRVKGRASFARRPQVWSRGVTRWFRWGLSISDPFVCRCLTSPIMLRFHTPLIEPDRRV